jgi:hypothetical protein
VTPAHVIDGDRDAVGVGQAADALDRLVDQIPYRH